MAHPSGCSYPRHEYYRKYYWLHKERYKLAYEDRKHRREELNKIYEEYDGERNYYRNSLLNSGFLIIKKTDISNINLN